MESGRLAATDAKLLHRVQAILELLNVHWPVIARVDAMCTVVVGDP